VTGDFALADAVRRCDRLAALAQRDDRHPGLVAAVVRPDRPLWTAAVGTDVTADHQFRIGSITKTFTAVLIMQLRDAGQLELRDPLSAHLDVPAHGTLTLRDLLAHTAGLQREPHGDVWDTLRMPDTGQLVAELELAEAITRPGRRWHYSNLAFALLGQVVATRYGAPWGEVLADRVLRPLGMARTTLAPVAPAAQGYLVEPYTDLAHQEGPVDLHGFAPAGQLWSTVGDLATWATFLATGHPEVLAAGTLDEMSEPVAMVQRDVFTEAWGLGLQLTHRGGRAVHAGHGGAMPGFLASLQVRRADRVGAVALGNNGVGEGIFDLTHELIEASLDADPLPVEPWRIGQPAPPEYASVLGIWWGEGERYAFRWKDGELHGRLERDPADRPWSVFAPADSGAPDVLRTVSGREAGELLRLHRDPDGTVTEMHWATYRFTRTQETIA
jgi:CubicO group peptidase (beta-lactamase class C family)